VASGLANRVQKKKGRGHLMNAGVWVVLAAIILSIAISAWKQYNFSIIASIVCVFAYIVTYLAAPSSPFGLTDELGFSPHDLVDPSRAYTILTAMYTHSGMGHLFFNLLGLILIGIVFEQKIGTRPYILLYILTGICGSLAFAALRWTGPSVIAVGASGAIFGIMGGFVRLFPRERFMFFFFPVALPIWVITAGYLVLQLLLIPTGTNVAIEAHIGGLIAGILLAPLVVKLPATQEKVRMVAAAPNLRKLATTPELESMLKRIEAESVPDVKTAWIDHFISKARCPQCGAPIVAGKGTLRCEKGHLI
jgi:membrane associated rhomboid family serine protease